MASEINRFTPFICSSTLIAPDVVLTAAHCIDESALTFGFGTVENLEVRWSRQSDLTSWDGSNPSSPWPEDAVVAWDWVAHPDFDMQDFDIGIAENNDIALVFLDRPITDIPHAYLPTDNLGELLNVGDEVNVVGWGQQTATSQFDAPPQGLLHKNNRALRPSLNLGAMSFKWVH